MFSVFWQDLTFETIYLKALITAQCLCSIGSVKGSVARLHCQSDESSPRPLQKWILKLVKLN